MLIDLIKEYLLIAKLIMQSLFIKSPPENWSKGKTGNIFIIQGFNETFLPLKYLGDQLNKAGYRIFTCEFNSRKPIKDIADIIKENLSKLNLRDVIFLAHSKGGLIAKYLLDNDKILLKIVKKVFAIASPFRGTNWGYLRIANLFELIPESSILNQLNSKTSNNYKIVSILPSHDDFVPKSSMHLKGATIIHTKVIGHTRTLINSETSEIILKILTK